MVCDHCGNTEEISDANATPIRELDFERMVRQQFNQSETEETRVSSCPNCGAVVEFDPTAHAAECPFCATPVVADTGPHRHIKPAGVAPFEITESDARDAMNNWLGKLWFAPSGLQDYARKGRRLSGIYVPYWTYDADTRTAYSGLRGDTYYETRRVMVDGESRQRKVAKTRWRPKSGRVARAFDDILVSATRSLPQRYTTDLAPWELDKLSPYAPGFLAGFRSEAYTIPLDEAFKTARAIMDRRITRDIKFDIGGDKQRIQSAKTDISDITFKHVLLPVWIAAYKYRGKSFRFVVNGQTGKVRGERPWSILKIAIAVIFALGVAAAIGYFSAEAQ